MKKDVNVSLVQGGKLTRGGWLSIVAFLLVAVVALSVALGLVVKSGKEKEPAEEVYAGGGMVLPEAAEGNGISLTSTVIPKEQYADYGIMPIAESSYSVTATAKAAGGVELSAAQQKFNWSLAWASSNAADVNTYVSLSASEGVRTATVSLLKPFSTQILLKCTWTFKDTQSGSLTLDYAKRFKGFNIQYASSVAKSASDESHLSTVLVGPQSGVNNVDLYLANPFEDGSWQNGPCNATVFRIVEPVFDSVGTLENSVVNYSHDSLHGSFSEETSTFDHISNQMFSTISDSICEDLCLYEEDPRDRMLELKADNVVSGNDREPDSFVPRNTRSFSQIDLLKSLFCGDVSTELEYMFGTSTSAPTYGEDCFTILSYLADNHSFTVKFPALINFQYGGSATYDFGCDISVHVDLTSAVSIDFTKSNFIF